MFDYLKSTYQKKGQPQDCRADDPKVHEPSEQSELAAAAAGEMSENQRADGERF